MLKAHRGSACCMGAALLVIGLNAAFGQSAPSGQPTAPPVMDDKMPPPFDSYPLGPDSVAHANVPAGKIFKFELSNSKIFPGTTREISVYVPAAYKGNKPACVYVGLDSLASMRPLSSTISLRNMPCRSRLRSVYLRAR